LGQTREQEARPRLRAISMATRQYRAFLEYCEQYDLLPKAVEAAFERLQTGEKADPRIARLEKIQRRQQELAIEKSIQSLRAQRAKKSEEAVEASNVGAF
jgi:hypothetical protein